MKRLSVTNLSLENNLPTFQLNAPVMIRAKVKEVQTSAAIYSHALLRILVIGGQRSVRVTPPSLPPHHSGPAIICTSFTFALMTAGAFSRNVGKLFSKLKLLTDNLYAAAN